MNDTAIELRICRGIQAIIRDAPRATFQEARNLGLLGDRVRVRAFFTLPEGQLYVDVRLDVNRDPAHARKMARRKPPSRLA